MALSFFQLKRSTTGNRADGDGTSATGPAPARESHRHLFVVASSKLERGFDFLRLRQHDSTSSKSLRLLDFAKVRFAV
jgi:hypothetical protein